MKTIGWIGTGVMGSSMVKHLLAAGFQVNVYNRTAEKAQALVPFGAVVQPDVATLAAQSDIIITMVGYPSDVEATYFGEQGILAHASPGAVLIDMTTSSPKLAKQIAKEAEQQKLIALDAPVSGGDIGAQQATLSIMVGGDLEAADVNAVFEAMGTNIVHQGPAGSGQHTKMSNQIAIASGMIAVSEAILYAQHAGLDPDHVLQSISSGAAGSWSLSNLVPRMLKGDFEPGFYVKHFIKDMRIAKESAVEMNLPTPGLDLALAMYEELAERGLADKGTQVIIQWFTRES